MNQIIADDAVIMANSAIPWNHLHNKTFLITGANGYVPAYFVHALLKHNDLYHSNIHIIALCRNEEKAARCFQSYMNREDFTLHIQDVCNPVNIHKNIHFFIHAASPAGYYTRHEKPADTYMANVIGALNLLELSRNNPVDGFLFISSVDIYGKPDNDKRLTETSYGCLDPLNPRNAYAVSKYAAEMLCASWYKQYNIPVSIARPFQILGPGISLDDGRLHSDFISQLLKTNKIVLKGDGTPRRTFMYITDAISAMLLVLLKGYPGEAYNICCEQGEAAVYELASYMAGLAHNSSISVEFDTKYRDTPEVRHAVQNVTGDSSKLRALGWEPQISLKDSLYRLMRFYNVIQGEK